MSVEFRWRKYEDDIAEYDWSEWHVVGAAAGECGSCCCGGPIDGEHQEPGPVIPEFGRTHTRCDPMDPDFREVERRARADQV